MILTDKEVQERIESPLNLLNRLRAASDSKPTSPSLPSPRSEDIVEDLEDKIKVGKVRGEAAVIMAEALDELRLNIKNISKPKDLAQIAETMNKILINRPDGEKEKGHQIVIYAPQIISETHFESIDVRE